MNQPMTKVDDLVTRWRPVLFNSLRPMDELNLRRLIGECIAELDDADSLGKSRLFELIGTAHFRVRDFTKAVEALKNSVRYNPDNPQARLSLGASLIGASKCQEAIAGLQAVDERFVLAGIEKVICYSNLAEAHWKLGALSRSRFCMLDALRHADLRSAEHLLGLANQHASIGADQDAAEFFARCLLSEVDVKRAGATAAAVIESLEPEWRVRFRPMPELVASIDRAVRAPDNQQLTHVFVDKDSFPLKGGSPGPGWNHAEANEYFGSLRRKAVP